MNNTIEELRKRYASLDTDDLLHIKVSSDLTEDATTLIDAELRLRDVSQEDYEEINKINTAIVKERDEYKENMKRRLKTKLLMYGVIFLFILIYAAFKSWK